MTPDDRTARLLATTNEERRFELIGRFVADDIDGALVVGDRLLASADALERELGADLLGQVATVRSQNPINIATVLIDQLARETTAEVVSAIVIALGHAGDDRARGPVVALVNHQASAVREAVAFSLPLLGPDDRSLEALRQLSLDVDDDVRDWATFGLAESDAGDPATLQALAARSEDPHDDTRAEAIYGLVRRGDPRARALVDRELARPTYGALIERARDELQT
jgi:HEAT repeat protein